MSAILHHYTNGNRYFWIFGAGKKNHRMSSLRETSGSKLSPTPSFLRLWKLRLVKQGKINFPSTQNQWWHWDFESKFLYFWCNALSLCHPPLLWPGRPRSHTDRGKFKHTKSKAVFRAWVSLHSFWWIYGCMGPVLVKLLVKGLIWESPSTPLYKSPWKTKDNWRGCFISSIYFWSNPELFFGGQRLGSLPVHIHTVHLEGIY